MHYSGKMNLLRFKNACIISVQGKTEKKKGVFIPIDDNRLFVSTDESGKAKGVYVDFMAWENRQPTQYGDTHALRQQYDKGTRSRMTEEEQRTVPYLGNMRPFETKKEAQTVIPDAQVAQKNEELPF